ncbi:uncharacterized protein [Drosophila bipectinata]|uniref:uncharacterized protein n=1 Tax=Drosophila bipectinata TaxID=42026 RepID=UPI0038B34C7D
MSEKINPEMTGRDEETRANIEMVRNLLEELERDPNPDYLDDLREATYNEMRDQLLEKLDGEMDALTERFEAAVKKMADDVQKRQEVNVINVSQVAVPSQDPKRPASKLLNAGVTTSPALEAPKSDRFVYRIVDANDLPISLKNRDIVVRRTQVESTTSNPITSSRATNRSETITSKEGIPTTTPRLKDIVVRRAQVESGGMDFKGFDDESPTTSSIATNRSEASTSKEGIPSTNPLLKGYTSQVYNPKKETSSLMALCDAAMSTVDENTLLKTRLLGEPYKVFKSESTSRRLELYTAGREKWGLSSILKNKKTPQTPQTPKAPKAPGRAPTYSYKDDLISFLKDNSSASRKVKESPSLKEGKESPSLKEGKESPNNNQKASSAKSTRWDKCIAELSECGLVFPSSSQRLEKSTSQPENSNNGNQSNSVAKEEYAPGLVTYDTPLTFQSRFEESINGGRSNRNNPIKGSTLFTRRSSPKPPSTSGHSVERSAPSRAPSPEPLTRTIKNKRRIEITPRALKPLVSHEDPKDDVDLYPREPKQMKR